MVMTEILGAFAVLCVCLAVAVIALAGIAAFIVWAFIRKVTERDQGVATELARGMTDAWNAGFDRRGEIDTGALENARLETERRRAAQHWKPEDDNRDQERQAPQTETLSVFGEEPLPPEMRA
jgi:hypothetical protein